MSDFRLRMFAAVARHLSFTKAAQELFISPPAVTKHIHEFEAQYAQRLLTRRGSRVALTEARCLLQAHAAVAQQQLDAQLLTLQAPTGRLRNINSEQVAAALLRGELDLGFVKGRSKSRDLHYELLMPDELVAVRRATVTLGIVLWVVMFDRFALRHSARSLARFMPCNGT